MANLSQIELNGTTYDLKDVIGRTHYIYIDSTTKVLLIGDSYNYGVGATEGRGWGYYFQQMTECNATIVHQNGGGFAAIGTSNATYPSKTHAQCVSLIPDTDFDLIIAQSGWNDSSTGRNPDGASAIITGVNNFISAAKAKWPKANIVVIPTNNDTEINQYKRRCLDTISETALLNGIRSSKNSIFWLKNTGFNASDNIHLSDNGYQLLASYIVSFMHGWDGGVSHIVEVPLSSAGASGITVHDTILTAYRDENWCFISGDITLTQTLSSYTTVLTGLPIPIKNVNITTEQWAETIVSGSNNISTFVIRRPIRAEVGINGQLNVRYGSAGNYRITLTYPLANEQEV